MRDAALALVAALAAAGGGLASLGRTAAEKMDAPRKKKLEDMLAQLCGGSRGSTPAVALQPRDVNAPTEAPPSEAVKAQLKKGGDANRGRRPPSANPAGGGRPVPKPRSGAAAAAAVGGDAVELSDLAPRSAEDVTAAFCELLSAPGLPAQLASADWKVRVEAMGSVVAALSAQPSALLQTPGACETVLRQLGHKPSWDEKNFQVRCVGLHIVGRRYSLLRIFPLCTHRPPHHLTLWTVSAGRCWRRHLRW